MTIMKPYTDLLQEVLNHGEPRPDRTGTGTLSLFGRQMKFDLSQGKFPLLTLRKLNTKAVVTELIWFIRGETYVDFLHKHGVRIWDPWTDAVGNLGPVYGAQWRNFGGVDQLKEVVRQLRKDRFNRRIIMSAWNPKDLPRMALPPCHMMVQFYVDGGERLHAQMYQRSADMFIGVPYNIAEYSLLVHLLARITGLLPGSLTHVIGDAHIYRNHIDQVKELLSRTPRPEPRLVIHPRARLFGVEDLEELDPNDIEFEGYAPHPHIPAPVAV